ncbi:MAG: orotidine-5'-phosphate decarboxylase [Acidimicrobiia bacterium]
MGEIAMRPMNDEERLIVALDVPGNDPALALVDQLGDAVRFYKVGLELFVADDHRNMIEKLRAAEKRVFADLKLYDVPNTVAHATKEAARLGVDFLTVHGDRRIMMAAAESKGDTKVMAVTVLTSFDESDLADVGFGGSLSELVLDRARLAAETGCDGVIASPQEARRIRDELGDQLIIVTPGIRPATDRHADDQKRVATAAEAIAAGADHIVVGRPIRSAPDPRAAAVILQGEIATALG